jgi:alpha-amylase
MDFGEDLCQAHPHVNKGLKDWGDWLTRRMGYDGYRFDFAKGIEDDYIRQFLSHGAMQGKFAVSEFWDSDPNALDKFVNDQAGLTSVFDFPLFYTLKDMCNDTSGGFDMRRLDGAGYAARNSFRAVTFVENHDTDRSDPIRTDKMMAYAFILTLEGYPCVFYKDYAVYNLKAKIDVLIDIRKKLAGGKTSTLYKDDDLFIAQRNGTDKLPGLVLVLNDNASQWKGAWVTVKSDWAGKTLKDYTGQAMSKTVAQDGRVELWAPPRGYAIYSPE